MAHRTQDMFSVLQNVVLTATKFGFPHQRKFFFNLFNYESITTYLQKIHNKVTYSSTILFHYYILFHNYSLRE